MSAIPFALPLPSGARRLSNTNGDEWVAKAARSAAVARAYNGRCVTECDLVVAHCAEV